MKHPEPAEHPLPPPQQPRPGLPGPHRRVFIVRLMSFSAAEEEKENTAPSSSPPLPAPPARKQKHRETKSTFHLLSLFFQRFQGQQSQCGEAWRKTTRGRVWPPDCGVCCGFKGLSGGWGGGGPLRCTPVSLGRWRQKEGRREGGQGLEGRQVGVTGARKLLEVQPFPMCCSSGPSASWCTGLFMH